MHEYTGLSADRRVFFDSRLNESLVSEDPKARPRDPFAYAVGGKSNVRVCNPNQWSQRSDFAALVQTCEELVTESCAVSTIIVTIMNLCNFPSRTRIRNILDRLG
jgi:hypothetical protein